MAVGDGRAGPRHARRQMGGRRRDLGEQAEGAVDVEPGAVAVGEVGHGVDRVEGAGVHLAGVGDHDGGGAAEGGQGALEGGEVEGAGVVSGEARHRRPPHAEHGQGLGGARVDVAAGEDRHRGQAGPAVGVDMSRRAARPTSPGRRPGR